MIPSFVRLGDVTCCSTVGSLISRHFLFAVVAKALLPPQVRRMFSQTIKRIFYLVVAMMSATLLAISTSQRSTAEVVKVKLL